MSGIGLSRLGSRRRGLLVAAGLSTFGLPRAFAGAQVEEPLADSVRGALAAAVAEAAPPKPAFESIEQRLVHLRWLGAMSDRLTRRKPDLVTRLEFLQALWYETARAGLEPALMLGLIQVESGFRRHAVSSAGARGYMQVMPFWTEVIGDGNPASLFDLVTNIRYGCVILRHYLDLENGNLFLALGRYNGSRGRDAYPKAVLAAWERWKFNRPVPATTSGAAR